MIKTNIKLESLIAQEDLDKLSEEAKAGFFEAMARMTIKLQVSGFGHVLEHAFGDAVTVTDEPEAPPSRLDALRYAWRAFKYAVLP